MKKTVMIAIMVLAIAASPWRQGLAKEMKIGYVNFMQVYNDYEKTKDYEEKLDEKKAEVEKKLESKREKIEELRNKISVLNEKEQEKQKEKLQAEVIEFRELERKAFIDVKKERDEKFKELFDDISGVVEDYAKKKDYDLILDQPAILYGDKVMDVTTDILKAANKKYKK